MLRLPLLAALAFGGCTGTTPTAAPAGHPASVLTASAPQAQDQTALSPAASPTLPAALRPSSSGAMAGMDHGAMAGMDHGAAPRETPGAASATDEHHMPGMNHGAASGDMPGMAQPSAPQSTPMRASVPGLTETLDAYLAVHDALASDRLTDATSGAAALALAFEALTAQPPADDAHLWHTHTAELATIRAQTAALARASDLTEARTAFGTLSAPLIPLVQAIGVPAAYDLALMTCGMAPGVPQGGVWMQRTGTTANPFFGAAMPTCGTRDGSVPTTGTPAPRP